MQIKLVKGPVYSFQEQINGLDLIKQLKKEKYVFADLPVAMKVNGLQKDLSSHLQDNDEVEILTFTDQEGRDIFWHSSAHLLAMAIVQLYPEALPVIGPSIENGFYYDFANLTLSEDDFPKIEKVIKQIINRNVLLERINYPDKQTALQHFTNNSFKLEMINDLEEGLSAYQHEDFVDLCRGPHIPHFGLIQGFKILKTSGAYWRADQNNEQLTRVYGISFPDKKQLNNYIHYLEEAKKRDHRIIGKKLNLFSFHEEAAGMPFFHPKGMIIWNELLKFWREMHYAENYQEIKTPIMMSRELWEISGHWVNYLENMYVSKIDNRDFAIKPMNCPGCMLYFKNNQYSYRQLPLRVGEIGNVHRHELSGVLSGLFRVRTFHQDDAHIFMKPEDISSEIKAVLQLSEKIYSQFGLEYHLELSTRPEKSIGTDTQWELATSALKEALDQTGHPYLINEGDGAFYGPKIDIHIKDAIGRTWQCGTVQLDMMMPERFDLTYNSINGTKERPIMIHRVIYGSIERFLGILIEHYAGKFPLWLSPIQIKILPVADRHHQYAKSVAEQFKKNGLRVEIDLSTESISKKVRNAQLDQINYMFILGDQEQEQQNISVRTRSNKVLGTKTILELIPILAEENQQRANSSIFD